jgi:hypothetical protein
LYNASLSFGDVHIAGIGGSNYFSSSYGGSKRGGVCEKACPMFSSCTTMYSDLMHYVIMHIIGIQYSEYAGCKGLEDLYIVSKFLYMFPPPVMHALKFWGLVVASSI